MVLAGVDDMIIELLDGMIGTLDTTIGLLDDGAGAALLSLHRTVEVIVVVVVRGGEGPGGLEEGGCGTTVIVEVGTGFVRVTVVGVAAQWVQTVTVVVQPGGGDD